MKLRRSTCLHQKGNTFCALDHGHDGPCWHLPVVELRLRKVHRYPWWPLSRTAMLALLAGWFVLSAALGTAQAHGPVPHAGWLWITAWAVWCTAVTWWDIRTWARDPRRLGQTTTQEGSRGRNP